MDDIKIRLRRGFGGMVPAICDEAANEIERLQKLYAVTNRLMVIIGAVGTVDSRHDTVTAVMDALYDIDGGTPPKS